MQIIKDRSVEHIHADDPTSKLDLSSLFQTDSIQVFQTVPNIKCSPTVQIYLSFIQEESSSPISRLVQNMNQSTVSGENQKIHCSKLNS